MIDSNNKSLPQPVLDPERQQQAREYARTGRYLSFAEMVAVGILLVLLVFGGFSERLTGYLNLPVIPAAILYFLILVAAYRLLTAPISYYRGYVLPRRYGLSKQSLSGWLGDLIKTGVLMLILGTFIIAAIYWLIDISLQNWWLLVWVLLVFVSLILSILLPVILVPLFYKTKPLEDGTLKEGFRQLAEKADADIKGIYTLDFSSKGTTANAAIMGLGKTKRIALSDTLLQNYSTEEIEVIIAHELGHQKNRDFIRIFLLQAAILFICLWLTCIITTAVVEPLGLGGVDNIVALPLLALVFSVVNIMFMPFSNTCIRYFEKAADSYALQLTENPQAFVSMMTRLTDQNLAEAGPGRWVELLLHDHPSYHSRLAHAMKFSELKQSGK